MKKVLGMLMALVCLCSLAACTGGGSQEAYTKEQAQQILDGGVFSETLEELDLDTAWALYGLSRQGLEREQLSDGMVYRSSGGTCEELALLVFQDEASAESAKAALEDYLQQQIAENENYRPAEIPKLEDPFLNQGGSTLLLVVSGQTETVKDVLK